jgi:hypothetical protein
VVLATDAMMPAVGDVVSVRYDKQAAQQLERDRALGKLGHGGARPGLDPGTPRFSIVISCRSSVLDLQGIATESASSTTSTFSRILRSFSERYGRRRGSSAFSSRRPILFEGAVVGLGLAFIFSDRLDRMRAQPGVLLGASAGLGFGVSDVAIKAVSGDVLGGSPWIALALCAAIFSFFASARSLQVGEGVAVIAVTSVAANMSSILAGVLVFGDPMGREPLEVAARIAGFVLVLVGAVLMPAPVRAAHAVTGPTPA